jgi:uncharacterized protein YcfL
MNARLSAAVFLLVAGVGCSRPANLIEHTTEPTLDSRIVVNDRLPVKYGQVSTRREGLIQHARVELVNTSNNDQGVEYRWEWTDADGFQLGDTVSSWQPAMLAGKTRMLLNGAAPGPGAVNFRLYMRAPGH